MRGKPRLWPASPIVFGLEQTAEATETTSTAATQTPTMTTPPGIPHAATGLHHRFSPFALFSAPGRPVRRTLTGAGARSRGAHHLS